MALFAQEHLDAVVAIGVPNSQKKGSVRWVATGFLFGEFLKMVDKDTANFRVYLVTNRHVFEGLDSVVLRFNRSSGGTHEAPLSLRDSAGKESWLRHIDSNVDIALTPVNAKFMREQGLAYRYFQSNNDVATLNRLREDGVMEGDGVFTIGFPGGQVGQQRNYVVVRQGCIARIRDCYASEVPTFLIDSPVFPGNSGGPVLHRPEVVSVGNTKASGRAYLMGVVSSYVPYQDVAVSEQTKRPRVVFEENSGLTNVVPVDRILDVTKDFEQRLNPAPAQPAPTPSNPVSNSSIAT